MADIFISYAKKAPEPTKALATDLARLKYEYWFDERLLPVEVFGQVINERIDKAKAVITIWSQPALKSRWVYAEALRADDQDKLLNVHTSDVRPGSIPVPFNAGHITPVEDRTAIYEALSRLGVYPSGFAPIDRVARAFELIEKSNDVEDFEAFVADFAGEGKQFYIRLAKKKITELAAGRSVILSGTVTAAGNVGVDVSAHAAAATITEVPLPQAEDVFLRIEPGMHTASIWRIGVDATGKLMVTGSDDKTARLWALSEGCAKPELLRTFRVPIGEGNAGKIYAVALSRDCRWVAAGGWDLGYLGAGNGTVSIYIFETATGRLVTRLSQLDDVILHLALSLDGNYLAAMLGSGKGMRLWETASWRLLAEDNNYGGEDSLGAAFDYNNKLYTVACDGQIRRYSADGHLEAKTTARGGKVPYSIAVQGQGAKLAVGFGDTKAVEVYDAHTLTWLYGADTGGISGTSLSGVAWSSDGLRLYAGGRYWSARDLVIWENEGLGRHSRATLGQGAIMHLLPYSNGVAVGAGDPAFGLIAADGSKRVWQEGVTADMRDKKCEAFSLSPDGKHIRFGLGQGKERPVVFDLASFSLRDGPQPAPVLAQSQYPGLAVTDWENNTAPKLGGKPIALQPYEMSRALAVSPDCSCFVLGTDYRLRAYQADDSSLWQKQIPGTAWGVNISGNGKLVVAAYGDGTIRWHRLSDGEELLALFVHAKDRRYIAWTPKGYYAASPGAEDLIGWHVNRGFDTAPDFYPASTFASTFNRPDIVKAALDI